MKHMYNASKQEIIAVVAEELKKIDEIQAPEWGAFVKTGTHKERPPMEADWWYKRSASIMFKLLDLGPVGVSKLRVKYGGKKRRGHKPNEFRKASGKIIRLILQQLEKAEIAKTEEKDVHKGRVLAPKGISIINNAAKNLSAKKE